MKDVELLAPVGSFESLKAAVQNGANAVYLGGKEFSARASANNFDKDELKEAVKYALMASMILNCKQPEYIYFERKNYYYPDMPKNYQSEILLIKSIV